MGNRAYKAGHLDVEYVPKKATKNKGKAWAGVKKPVWQEQKKFYTKPRHVNINNKPGE